MSNIIYSDILYPDNIFVWSKYDIFIKPFSFVVDEKLIYIFFSVLKFFLDHTQTHTKYTHTPIANKQTEKNAPIKFSKPEYY